MLRKKLKEKKLKKMIKTNTQLKWELNLEWKRNEIKKTPRKG